MISRLKIFITTIVYLLLIIITRWMNLIRITYVLDSIGNWSSISMLQENTAGITDKLTGQGVKRNVRATLLAVTWA